jgi:primosomal protein N' (replication factor Y)
LESYHRALSKQYRLEELTERVNKSFPEVHVVDMRRELAAGNTGLFSQAFKAALRETLDKGKQAILFMNRRGHSGFVSCRWCGHVLSCDKCRVNYTYHATGYNGARLLCHYCGGGMAVPDKCPVCGSPYIRFFGMGTQKIEEEMAALFPDAVCLRMDFDSTRGKHGHANILEAFRKGEAQVLIGTQMIAKGLDFPNVTFVGVAAADMSLFTGDYRAGEHTFQLLTQVSGRSGRAGETGQVFLQTYNPEHYCLQHAKRADYLAFYRHEISLREAGNYPPFSHVFSVMLTGPDEKEIVKALNKLFAIMQYSNTRKRSDIEFELLGVTPAFISKIKNQYRWKLLVKCIDEESLKRFVLYCVGKLRENDPLEGITVHLTLDPIMME